MIWFCTDFHTSDDGSKINDIFVEFHGLLFDVILFGIVLTIYDYFSNRRERIEKANNEIDDFREWKEKEATFRIVGNVRRLVKEGVNEIDLSHCHLPKAWLHDLDLQKSKFIYANLSQANFEMTNLSGAVFFYASLNSATLCDINISHCNFEYANLNNASLRNSVVQNANFKNASLKEADVNGVKFSLAQLKSVSSLYNCRGIEKQLEKILIEEKPELFEKPQYQKDLDNLSENWKNR